MTGDNPLLQLIPFVIFLPVLWAVPVILKKMGYSRWLALLWLLPPVGIAFVIWLALTTWPIEKAARSVKG